MKLLRFRYIAVLLNIILVLGCSSVTLEPVASTNTTNIILFIGDGMGNAHRLAARWATVGETGMLSMDDMSTNGWAQTGSTDDPVTDSAAAATAMSTGVKTNNGVLLVWMPTSILFLPY